MSEENVSESGVIRADDEPVINFHTLLIALYPLFGLYAHNMDKTPVAALARPMMVLAVLSLATIILCRRIVGDRDKGSVAATVVMAAIFSGWSVLLYFMATILPSLSGYPDWLYYAAYTVLFIVVAAYASTRLKGGVPRIVVGIGAALVIVLIATDGLLSAIVPRGHAWFMMGYAVVIGGIVAWIRYSSRDFRSLSISMNWFGAVLIALSMLNIFYNAPEEAPTLVPTPLENMPEAQAEGPLPDIYCVVVGGRGREDIHHQYYDVDDAPFERELEANGVEVVDASLANYPNLLFSLSSTLNMDYLQALPNGDAITTAQVADLFHENRVAHFLREQGYEILVGAPRSELLEPRDDIEESITPDRMLSEFEIVLLENSAFSPMVQAFHYLRRGSVAEIGHMAEHGRVYQLLDRLATLPSETGDRPRFVLAVLPIPEAPFLFDSEGNWPQSTGVRMYAGRPEFVGDVATYRQYYGEQLRFTDEAILQWIKHLADENARPSVAVIMSAHGPSSSLVENRRRLDLRERFSSFISVGSFGAETPRVELPERMSAVNVFRIVLNDVFGSDLPLLEDRLYLIKGDNPVVFEPITRPAE